MTLQKIKIFFMIQIYHNSRCRKSRECLSFLEDSGQEYEIVKYRDTILSFDALKLIIKKLNLKPIELVRRKENIWIENFKDKVLTDNEIILAMISNPILINRPIVVNEEKAVIARPLEKIIGIL